ncbi:hypothetical protein QR680_019353 [Steinernema hermaphroditum]|uniref:Uncharacterized protein n=1 Tax=Steinernema hermaphroditum TaxID=289476 RepID=A0AA39GNG8_9BILA|nr:hypothetical protein QR680_019353 [Steinernema hermaphroditum]
MQTTLTLICILSLALALNARPHRHRHVHKRSHAVQPSLLPQPKEIDPSKMSYEEVQDLYNKLADYLRTATGLGHVSKKKAYSHLYEEERKRYQAQKKASDAFSIASSLAMQELEV